jgi:hypothetical protein
MSASSVARRIPSDIAACALVAALALLAYAWLELRHLPASGTNWGVDYSLHLPNLLAGCYWQAQNGLAIPWLTPAQCGGVPFFPDLNVAYYSLPQWLAFFVGPVPAVRVTFIVFAALGACGVFSLLAHRFHASLQASLVAAVLFLFNTFFTARMLGGHLTFHPFTLVPWVAWSVLAPAQAWRQGALGIVLAGLAFAYMFQAGMVHGIGPGLLAIAVIVAVHGQLYGHRRAPWVTLGAAGLLALAVCAERLAAAGAFLAQFPRSGYLLPGFATLLGAAQQALVLVFWRPPYDPARLLANVQWTPDTTEFAFSVGPVALLALAAGACVLARRRSLPGARGIWLAVALAGCVPILLNWYWEPWNAALKSLPFFGSSSILLRWYAAYIPVVTLFAALALDVATQRRWRWAVALTAVAGTVTWNALVDDSSEYGMVYDAAPVQRAWQALSAGGDVPAVERIVEQSPAVDVERNDALIRGESELRCYQPMFGYRLERMPVAPLRSGPALAEAAPGVLNVKDPACYVWPTTNGCRPGDHFAVGARERAEHFLRYQAVEFAKPGWQTAASVVTRLALLACAIGLVVSVPAIRRSR